MRTFPRWLTLLLLVAGLAPATGAASVGAVAALTGQATRAPVGGAEAPLAVGQAIELLDTVRVARGELEVRLNDGSLLLLAQGSELAVREADFEGQERKTFLARLRLGALWAKVTHAVAGSSAKFEVESEQAVAGVRGTVFEVQVVSAADGPSTHVAVSEGKVAVSEAGREGAAPSGALLEAGQAAAVDRNGLQREAPRPLPEGLRRFIEERDRTREGTDRRREKREEKHQRHR